MVNTHKSTSSTVLILGSARDQHAAHVAKALEARGIRPVYWDTSGFPQSGKLRFDPSARDGVLGDGTTRITFSAVRSIYWRTYAEPQVAVDALPHPDQRNIAYRDARSLLEGVFEALPCRWVNGWEGFDRHQRKPAALAAVASLGVPIPETIFTNDADTVREFVERHRRCVFKPVQGGAHARPLAPEDLDEGRLGRLALAPVALQRRVDGINVRAFVAGDRVLACALATEELDYRDDPNPTILAHRLSTEEQALCVRIARKLALTWTGIDFVRSTEGDLFFLEANPSPMFLGFETRSGLPLTEALVDLLQ